MFNAGYDVLLVNTTRACEQLVPQSCLSRLSIDQCVVLHTNEWLQSRGQSGGSGGPGGGGAPRSAAIAGGAAAAGAAAAAVAGLVVLLVVRRRRRRKREDLGVADGPGEGRGGKSMHVKGRWA